MGDAFAAIKEKWNLVTVKNSRKRFVVIVQMADDDRAIAKTISVANKFQNLACGKNGLGLGVCANAQGDGRWKLGVGNWLRPVFFKPGKFCFFGETIFP